MPEQKSVFDKTLRIRFRGQYDYDGLIALLRSFYGRAKIVLEQPKFKYKGDTHGFEVEFDFKGNRKVNSYINVYLFISGHGFDVDPKEVVVNGVKKRMTGGKMQLEFSAKYELDWGKGFETKEEEYEGIMYEDNKALGKKHMQDMIRKFHKETVKFLGMECY